MKNILRFASIFIAAYLLFWVLFLPRQNTSQKLANPGSQRSPLAQTGSSSTATKADLFVGEPITPTISQPARDLPEPEEDFLLDREVNPRLNLNGNIDQTLTGGIPGSGIDPLLALQANVAPHAPNNFLTPILNLNAQDYTNVNPPDTVGDVGPNHYVHMVNFGSGSQVVIYDKSGAILAGPFALDNLGSGNCANGMGDPIVLYDQLADRWLLSEFSTSGNNLCVYISITPNPTGSYYAYAFTAPSFPDYPKYGVWPDAYYVSSNENDPAVYALDRVKMLIGQAATFQRFSAPALSGFSFQALTPSDLDGATPPPAGAPNYFMRHRDTESHGPAGYPTEDFLEIWAFHADFANPANATFTQVGNIAVAEFDSNLCGLSSYNCFPQLGSGTTLDPLREVVMFPLVYRNFGGYEVLLGNLVTDVDNTDHGGIRWFELRKTGAGNWALYQEGTFAPDSRSRWMGSIAMDGSGNIAVGYSVSSSSMYPSIRYAGRLASDPVGTLPYYEGTIVAGTSANGSNRWGDYSAMGIDPSDDCTFWYTNMYSEGGSWNTRFASFKFDACGTADFTLSAAPAAQDVCLADDAVFDVTIGQVQNYSDPVTLSASGLPAGTTASFGVNPVIPPGSSQLTIGNTGAALPGSYAIAVWGIAPTSTHTTTVQLNLFDNLTAVPTPLSPANGATDVTVQPAFSWNPVTGSTAYYLEIATDPDYNNVVEAATVTATSYTPAAPLAPGTLYYWRVTAVNICGQSAPSASSIFATSALNLVCNSAPINIPDSGPGSLYPSTINVAGYGASLEDVNVHLLNLSHSYPDDLDMLLVGPQGQNLVVMSDVGGGSDITAVDLILDDAAAAPLPDSTAIASGAYRPANYLTGDTFPAPAPAPSAANALATFNNTDPNGVWSLYLVDDAGGDAGALAGGWCLELTTAGSGQASLALTTTVGLDPNVYASTHTITVTGGATVTYFYVVENTGSVTLPLHHLADSHLGTVLGPDYAYNLAPGERLTITASTAVTQTISRSAIWLATAGVNMAAASDSATVVVTQPGYDYLYLPVIMKP